MMCRPERLRLARQRSVDGAPSTRRRCLAFLSCNAALGAQYNILYSFMQRSAMAYLVNTALPARRRYALRFSF
eukprot:3779177-Pleurochrysis_carterae.AAC.1